MLVLEERNLHSSKGKGRGNRTNATENRSWFPTFQSRESQASTSSSHSEQAEQEEDPLEEVATTETKRIYIKKVELLLNGAPLGKYHTNTFSDI